MKVKYYLYRLYNSDDNYTPLKVKYGQTISEALEKVFGEGCHRADPRHGSYTLPNGDLISVTKVNELFIKANPQWIDMPTDWEW